jgi:hypothetical protein
MDGADSHFVLFPCQSNKISLFSTIHDFLVPSQRTSVAGLYFGQFLIRLQREVPIIGILEQKPEEEGRHAVSLGCA